MESCGHSAEQVSCFTTDQLEYSYASFKNWWQNSISNLHKVYSPSTGPLEASEMDAFQTTSNISRERFLVLTGTHTSQQETVSFWLQLDNILACDHRPLFCRLPLNSIMSAERRMRKCLSLFLLGFMHNQLPCFLKYFTPQLKSPKLFHSYYRPLDFLQNVVSRVDCGSEEEF